MTTIEVDILVDEEGKAETLEPTNLVPGKHRVIMTLVDDSASTKQDESRFDFPLHDIGPWPEGLSLRREDMYGDWGR